MSIEETLHSSKMGGYAGRVDVIFLDKNDKLITFRYTQNQRRLETRMKKYRKYSHYGVVKVNYKRNEIIH